jgi:protein-S-isoprenylcysteine O-methyltransferase Ste14
MKATNWEFTNRALLFGLIFAFSFPLYFLDHQNSAAALASWLGFRLQKDPDSVARLLFAFAAILVIVAALVRTWASSYLRADVVYAAEVKTESLVADGPYRQVRNPLYFANVLMVIGIGAMMSRLGFFVAAAAMLVFCYRLILREEAELQANQGAQYEGYSKAVQRLWPSLWPRIASGGRQAKWADGFKAESVLGIRSGTRSPCHNSKSQAVFRDSGSKPSLVLGVLSGSSKEVKLASLTGAPLAYCRQVRHYPQTGSSSAGLLPRSGELTHAGSAFTPKI